MFYPSSSTGDVYLAGMACLLAEYTPFDIPFVKFSTTAFHKCSVSLTSMSRCVLHLIHASVLHRLGCEHVYIQYCYRYEVLSAYFYKLFTGRTAGAGCPAPYGEHMNVVFPLRWGTVTAYGPPQGNVVGCVWKLWYFPPSQCNCTTLQSWKQITTCTRFMFSMAFIFSSLTHCMGFFFFSSKLLRDYKLVHPGPLALILLSLQIFLFIVALSFHGGFLPCLIDDTVPWQMNSMAAFWHPSAPHNN